MKITSATAVPSRKSARFARLSVSALAIGALSVTAIVEPSGAAAVTIESATVPHFAGALVNQSLHSLYVLSSEKGAALRCTGSCLSSWLPVEVSTSTSSVGLGAGVKGKIGFVARSKSKKQVTFNSYPLYTFVGDSGARESHGQGVKAFGGTWSLVKAGARTPAATPFKSSAPTTPTTTTPTTAPTTTTTTPGGGGGVGY